MSYVAVGVGIMALGEGLNIYNQQQAADARDKQEANAINEQSALDRKANQDTQQLLRKDTQNNNDTTQRSQLMTQFQKALAANAPNATGGLNQVGAVSGAYTKAANDAASGISQYATGQAGNLSDMTAPFLQRQSENSALANYGSQIGAISQQSQGDAFVNNVKLNSIQANPWLAAAAAGMTTAGGAMAGGGMSGMLTGAGGAYTGSGTGQVVYNNGYGVNLPYAANQ